MPKLTLTREARATLEKLGYGGNEQNEHEADPKAKEKTGYTDNDKLVNFASEMEEHVKGSRFPEAFRNEKNLMEFSQGERTEHIEARTETFRNMDFASDKEREQYAKDITKQDFKHIYNHLDKVEHDSSFSYPEDVRKAMNKAGIKAQDTWRGEDGTIYFNFKNEKQLAQFNKAYGEKDKARAITGEENLAYARQQRDNNEWNENVRKRVDEYATQYKDALKDSPNEPDESVNDMQQAIEAAAKYAATTEKSEASRIAAIEGAAGYQPDENADHKKKDEKTEHLEEENASDKKGVIGAIEPTEEEKLQYREDEKTRFLAEISRESSEIADTIGSQFTEHFKSFDTTDEDAKALDYLAEKVSGAAGNRYGEALAENHELRLEGDEGEKEYQNLRTAQNYAVTTEALQIMEAIEQGKETGGLAYSPSPGEYETASVEWTDEPPASLEGLRQIHEDADEMAANMNTGIFARRGNHLQSEMFRSITEELGHNLEQAELYSNSATPLDAAQQQDFQEYFAQAQTAARALQYLAPDRDHEIPQPEREPAAV